MESLIQGGNGAPDTVTRPPQFGVSQHLDRPDELIEAHMQPPSLTRPAAAHIARVSTASGQYCPDFPNLAVNGATIYRGYTN